MRTLLICVAPVWFALCLFGALYLTMNHPSEWTVAAGLTLGVTVGLAPALLAWKHRGNANRKLPALLAKGIVATVLGVLACAFILLGLGYLIFVLVGPV